MNTAINNLENNSYAKDKTAKILRMITVPPVLVTTMIFTLYCTTDIFTAMSDTIVPILGLGIFPVLAYPAQKLMPSPKEEKRITQRKLAFIFSLIGYVTAFLYGLAANVNYSLKVILRTYLFSVIVLSVFNKVFKLRASGHACSSIAPTVFCFYYSTVLCGIVFAFLFSLSVWSSLHLKRHKPIDIFLGVATFGISFFLALIL